MSRIYGIKNKITIFLDAIFSFILFTLLFYALTKRLASAPIPLIASISLALIFQNLYLCASIKNRKNAKKKENMRNFFIFTPVNAQEYLETALHGRYQSTLENNRLTIGDSYVYTALSLTPLSYSNVVDAFKNRTKDKIVIFCFSYDKKAYRLASSLPCDIKILNEDDLFYLLQSFNALPKTQVQITKKYPFKSFLLDLAYAKHNKRLLFSAFVITLFSFISPFKNYYTIVALFLLLLAVIPSIIRLTIKR